MAYFPVSAVDHILTYKRWNTYIQARPILYHIESGYLTAGKRPVVPQYEITKDEETDGVLVSFLQAIMPKSNLAKMKAILRTTKDPRMLRTW